MQEGRRSVTLGKQPVGSEPASLVNIGLSLNDDTGMSLQNVQTAQDTESAPQRASDSASILPALRIIRAKRPNP